MERIPAPGGGDLPANLEGFAVALLLLLLLVARFGYRRWRWGRWPFRRSRSGGWSGGGPRPFRPSAERPKIVDDVTDPVTQLRAVGRVTFETAPLLNRTEYPVFRTAESVAEAVGGGFRVMAQVSLGEVIRPAARGAGADDRDLAFRSINSKRLDIAIFNPFGKLVVALEVQGAGHHQGTAFLRDAVKREALRRAGVPMVEVETDTPREELVATLRRLLEEHRALMARSGPR